MLEQTIRELQEVEGEESCNALISLLLKESEKLITLLSYKSEYSRSYVITSKAKNEEIKASSQFGEGLELTDIFNKMIEKSECLSIDNNSDKSLKASITCLSIEIRRLGILPSFALIESSKVSNKDLFACSGLPGAGNYFNRFTQCADMFVCRILGTEEGDTWRQPCSLRDLIMRNPFPLRINTSDHHGQIDPYLVKSEFRKHFSHHWIEVMEGKGSLERSLRVNLVSQEAFLRALLVEYNVVLSGWRTGLNGTQTLHERLNARLQQCRRDMVDVGISCMQTMPDSLTTMSETDSWFLNLSCITSVPSSDILKQACTMFDSFINSTDEATVLSKCTTSVLEKRWAKLVYTVHEILGIVMTNLIERLIFLIHSSIVGYLDAAQTISGAKTASCVSISALNGILGVQRRIPPPWQHIADANTLREYLTLARLYSRHGEDSMPMDLSFVIRTLAKRTPIYVINLARRVDRWNCILNLCRDHDLTAIRISAVDGSITDSHTKEILDSVGNMISDRDVTNAWDTSLNAKFDENCVPDAFIPLTPTERACAQSHINIWRLIASGKSDEIVSFYRSQGTLFTSNRSGARHEAGEEWFLILEDDAGLWRILIQQYEGLIVEYP